MVRRLRGVGNAPADQQFGASSRSPDCAHVVIGGHLVLLNRRTNVVVDISPFRDTLASDRAARCSYPPGVLDFRRIRSGRAGPLVFRLAWLNYLYNDLMSLLRETVVTARLTGLLT